MVDFGGGIKTDDDLQLAFDLKKKETSQNDTQNNTYIRQNTNNQQHIFHRNRISYKSTRNNSHNNSKDTNEQARGRIIQDLFSKALKQNVSRRNYPILPMKA